MQVTKKAHPAFKSDMMGFNQENHCRHGGRDAPQVYPESRRVA